MDRHELLRRITTFPLVARGLAEDLLSGDFRSVFTGQGIEFDEVRHYEPGDDVRSIDWNVSARFGTPYVKMYREERELTVCLVLDESASMFAASTAAGMRRRDQAILAAALVAFSAERAGQRIGAVCFGEEITRVFNPRKGRSHIMSIISGLLREDDGGKGSNLGLALEGCGRLLKRRSLVVILSDFLCLGWEQELGYLCAKHDVIAIRITDPLDAGIPNLGLLTMRDPETGVVLHAPTGYVSFRSAWTEWHDDRTTLWKALCRRCGAAYVELSTASDAPTVLTRFFGGRRTGGSPL
ncbi:hypothetical protein AGMMS4952_03880 [Spirochaetia bacterium]|nr:hypothetical protein AGMMS4952_03880 [Spirochaetia bacterium]